MGNRLSKIATRTGDKGTTGLGDGSRIDKDSLRVHAMGDVDELNSYIGLLLCEPLPDALINVDGRLVRPPVADRTVVHAVVHRSASPTYPFPRIASQYFVPWVTSAPVKVT